MEGKPLPQRGYIICCSIISLIIGSVLGYFSPHPQTSAAVIVSTAAPVTDRPAATPTTASLRIHVTGAVHDPGVYTLTAGSIAQDAITAAGGATREADLNRINLAIELHDQQQIYVPHQGETDLPVPVVGSPNEDSDSGLVNINSATITELETLPRIGPATAQRIIDYREANGPFLDIADIQNGPGIGPATFAGLEELITVGP